MTESDWLNSTDPAAMLYYLQDRPPSQPRRISDRKLRLWICALCRQVWDRLADDECRRAVEIGESSADGLVTEKKRLSWLKKILTQPEPDDPAPYRDNFFLPAWAVNHDQTLLANAGHYLERAGRLGITGIVQAALLREVVGNPFRLVKLPPARCPKCGWLSGLYHCPNCKLHGAHPWLTWQDRTISRLAQRIYDDRGFAALSILADALEEAGCTNEAILSHLRQTILCRTCRKSVSHLIADNRYGGCPWCGSFETVPLQHVRGCFVIDCILGKS